MKVITVEVSIRFQDHIDTDEEIAEVVGNVLRAMENESETGQGLAPENSETFPTEIQVREQYTQTIYNHKFI